MLVPPFSCFLRGVFENMLTVSAATSLGQTVTVYSPTTTHSSAPGGSESGSQIGTSDKIGLGFGVPTTLAAIVGTYFGYVESRYGRRRGVRENHLDRTELSTLSEGVGSLPIILL